MSVLNRFYFLISIMLVSVAHRLTTITIATDVNKNYSLRFNTFVPSQQNSKNKVIFIACLTNAPLNEAIFFNFSASVVRAFV